MLLLYQMGVRLVWFFIKMRCFELVFAHVRRYFTMIICPVMRHHLRPLVISSKLVVPSTFFSFLGCSGAVRFGSRSRATNEKVKFVTNELLHR